MRYNHEIDGVELQRDIYAEQFAEPGDMKANYMLMINGDCVDESEDKRGMAKRMRKTAKRLFRIADFLDRKPRQEGGKV